MIYDERLIGRKPSDKHIEKSKARLRAMFQRRFEERVRMERHASSDATYELLRRLGKEDPALAAAVKTARARSAALAKKRLHQPKVAKVRPRIHQGSVAITFVPPFTWATTWNAATGKSAFATPTADANAGTMGFQIFTGDNGKTGDALVAVGSYFQPSTDNGIMDVAANPAFNYYWGCDNILDHSQSGAYVGIYIAECTPDGDYVRDAVDQRIFLWNVDSGHDQGSNSGFPLSVTTPVDSNHLYEFWVLAGGGARGDGWGTFGGSSASCNANFTVPSITVAAYG
jgi:hypothetical protein